MLKVKVFDSSNAVLHDEALKIRMKVFVEGQHVDPSLEVENEADCTHYLLYLDDRPVATARWRQTPKGIKLERFAMLKEYRNKGYGSVLLEKVMEDILPLKQKIYLHSQLKAVSYYRQQGFVKQGEIFQEAGIDHYLMVREADD
jgi:predicted GNAT family N-acyltransferase